MRVALFALALLAGGSAVQAAPIFTNNFETNSNGFTIGADVYITAAPKGQKFLELQNNGSSSTLTLDTTGYVGGSLTVSFDVYVVGSMDGTGQVIQGGGVGDYFNVASGGNMLLSYAFANFGNGNKQTYPVAGSDPTTGATAVNSLGYGGFPDSGNGFQDSIYSLSVTLTPLSNTTSISFTSTANEGAGNEFYGFDNVVATATPAPPAVPEPASWLMMVGGFGLIGGALRHRRPLAVA